MNIGISALCRHSGKRLSIAMLAVILPFATGQAYSAEQADESASLAASSATTRLAEANCKPWLRQTFRQLHSSDSIDLCQRASGKALIVVNTASHCGFTPQFKSLEALYEARREDGLEIIGIPSDDFNQEAASQAEVAEVCYKNFGVSFMMTEPDHVKGEAANPLHRWLIASTGESPRWNFYKYVIAPDGVIIGMFPSQVAPDSQAFRDAVDLALSETHRVPGT